MLKLSAALEYSALKPLSLAVASEIMLATADGRKAMRPRAGSRKLQDWLYREPNALDWIPVTDPGWHSLMLEACIWLLQMLRPDPQSRIT